MSDRPILKDYANEIKSIVFRFNIGFAFMLLILFLLVTTLGCVSEAGMNY